MALTVIQKSGLRRHLGYPAIGLLRVSPGGGGMTVGGASASWRFFEAYGMLEYKMNNLNPDEEARITGAALGSVALVGPEPNPGDQVTVTFAASYITPTQSLTVTAPPHNGSSGLVTLTNALAAACSLNQVLQAAGFFSATPYGNGPFSQNEIPLAEVTFAGPGPFTITASGTGLLAPQITAQGAFLQPSTSLDGIATIYGYLPILDGLEGAVAGSSQNLDTSAADVWKARANEIGQRQSLYEIWQHKLSDFTGVPINPSKDKRRSPSGLRYV